MDSGSIPGRSRAARPCTARRGRARPGCARRSQVWQGNARAIFDNRGDTTRVIDFRIQLTGTAPLLMHNSRLADPLDSAAKALAKKTGKKTGKTDDDHREIARLEHLGGLYYDDIAGPYVPSDNIWRALYDSATKRRLGKIVKECVVFDASPDHPNPDGINPLRYNGPRDTDGLWKDENFRYTVSAIVSRKRIMRTRPKFPEWSVEAYGILDPGGPNSPTGLDWEKFVEIARVAGEIVGLGDWRPKYGRFVATVERV